MTTDHKEHFCTVCQKEYSEAQEAIQCCSKKKSLSQKAEEYYIAATKEIYKQHNSKKDK